MKTNQWIPSQVWIQVTHRILYKKRIIWFSNLKNLFSCYEPAWKSRSNPAERKISRQLSMNSSLRELLVYLSLSLFPYKSRVPYGMSRVAITFLERRDILDCAARWVPRSRIFVPPPGMLLSLALSLDNRSLIRLLRGLNHNSPRPFRDIPLV